MHTSPLTAQQKAMDAIELQMAWREQQYRKSRGSENRARRRGLMNHYAEHRDELLGFLSRHPAPSRFESLSEAIVWFRKEMARQRMLNANGHWAFSNGVLAACKERQVIARYFQLVEQAEAAEQMEREAA